MARIPLWMLLAFVLAAGPAGRAEDIAAAAASATASQRDPFWPVNYAPAAGAAGRELSSADLLEISNLSPEEQALIKAHLRVGGILRQNRQLIAIINKQVVRQGDSLTVNLSGHTYRFIIRSLEEKNIVLEPEEPESTEQPQPEGAKP